MKKFTFIALAVLLLACNTKAPSKIQDDTVLYKEGMHYFNKGSYISAIDYFSQIKNRFPESPHIREAKLKLAQSYYESKEFIDAEIEYQQFTTMHPLYPGIAEVWFELGMSQYKQAPKSAQKNLKQIEIAKNTFEIVRTRWPASDVAQKSKEMMQKCIDKEIEKQLYLARFYYRTKKFDVSQKKLEEISLSNTQNINHVGERNILLARVYLKNEQWADAKEIFEAILRNDDLFEYHMESKKGLRQVSSKMQ